MSYKGTKAMVHSLNGDSDFVVISCKEICWHNLSRLCNINVNRSNERKWLHTKKVKKLIVSHKNYYGCRLCR